MPLFHLDDASARYNGRDVLHGISLDIESGERVALVGQSGAGKSTLLQLLFEQQTEDTALVPQDFGLVKTLSVFHNVYMGCLNRHASWYNIVNLMRPIGREVDKIREVLKPLGLEDKIFTPTGELSGGQQQRTAVGRALNCGHSILFGDEPVSAVDDHQARDVLETVVKSHATVVLAMHDVALALTYTERVIGLRDGRIVIDEPTAGMKPSDLDAVYQGQD